MSKCKCGCGKETKGKYYNKKHMIKDLKKWNSSKKGKTYEQIYSKKSNFLSKPLSKKEIINIKDTKTFKTKRSMPYGLNAGIEFIETILMSAYVGKEISAIIVSSPDSGKSQILLQYFGNKGLIYLSDATSFGILDNLSDALSTKKIRYIIIPDFLKIIERNKKVFFELLSTLNSLCEEGHSGSLTFNIKLLPEKPLGCGFITSLTMDAYKRLEKRFDNIGFSSRIITFFFDYNREDLELAKKSILVNKEIFKPKKLLFKEKNILINDKQKELIKSICELIDDPTRFRTIRNIITFVKAHALLKNRDKVTEEDILFLKAIIPFLLDYSNDCDFYIIKNLPSTEKMLAKTLDYSSSLIFERLRLLESKELLSRVNDVWKTTY